MFKQIRVQWIVEFHSSLFILLNNGWVEKRGGEEKSMGVHEING